MTQERKWAVITNGTVTNKVVSDVDLHATHGGDQWIEVTNTVPQPESRWTYTDGVFAPPEEAPE